MVKRKKIWCSIMHTGHRLFAIHHIAMMDIAADMAKYFGHSRWIDKWFFKHDRKAGYHLDQLSKYA